MVSSYFRNIKYQITLTNEMKEFIKDYHDREVL